MANGDACTDLVYRLCEIWIAPTSCAAVDVTYLPTPSLRFPDFSYLTVHVAILGPQDCTI